MALNIKDVETDRLARELAQLTGLSITAVVKAALARELESARSRTSRSPGRRDAIQGIIDRGRARPVLNDLTEDEILGYDEFGIPS